MASSGPSVSAPNASADRALSEALARGNPVVFMDVAIEGVPQGRIRMELFQSECPRTVENFRCVLFSSLVPFLCAHDSEYSFALVVAKTTLHNTTTKVRISTNKLCSEHLD